MRQIRLKKIVLAAAIILLPLAARSQEQVSIPRISGELKFDGIVDEIS